jgi:hypothetical protein
MAKARRISAVWGTWVLAATLCAPALGAPTMPKALPAAAPSGIVFRFATDDVWTYARRGLCYLESPKPQHPPEAVAPDYLHPDGIGFGAYGMTPGAYADVQKAYPYFRDIPWPRILRAPALYELASRAFADKLLSRLQEEIPSGSSPRQVFGILHQAWNVGLSGFKSGRRAVPSRFARAREFMLARSY